MTAIVHLDALTRTFGSVTAVDRLSFSIAEGEVFGLVGPDGAGKTTTLRMLASLLAPSSGRAQVAGRDVAAEGEAVKDAIGYMAQRFGLYADLSVDENLDFYSDLFGVGRQERERLLPGLLQMTRMQPFRARQAGKLSGGMKQKLALMCTLIHRPKVLFLDEPTNGVDPVSRRDFWEILKRLVDDGMTVLIATAYLDEAERCDRVALIDRGQLIRCDSPAGLKASIEEPCYEIAAADIRRARSWLETQPGVLSVEPFGRVLHLFASADADGLAAGLRAQNLEGVAVRPIVPSLEDVFIAHVRKRGVPS